MEVNNRLKITYISLLFIIVVMVGLMFYKNIDFEAKVNPLEVIGVCLSCLSTLYAAHIITKHFTEQRYKKEYVISDLKSIENIITDLEVLFSLERDIELQNLLDKLNSLRIVIDRFAATIDIFNINCNRLQQLFNAYLALYKLTTNVESNVLSANSVNKNDLGVACSNLLLEVRMLVKIINESN